MDLIAGRGRERGGLVFADDVESVDDAGDVLLEVG